MLMNWILSALISAIFTLFILFLQKLRENSMENDEFQQKLLEGMLNDKEQVTKEADR